MLTPSKEVNGYRNYSEEDIQRILIIQDYRQMGLSVLNIKDIFNGEKTSIECLGHQEQLVQEEIIELEKRLHCIQKRISRKRCYYVYKQKCLEEESLNFDENAIVSSQYKETFEYDNIDKIVLSLCSRTYNGHSTDYLKAGWRGMIGVKNVGLRFSYHIDMDICIGQSVYTFESYDLGSSWDILNLLDHKNIKIEDPLQLIRLFSEKKTIYDIQKYFDYHMRKIAKEYNLDNPRDGYDADELIQLVQKML